MGSHCNLVLDQRSDRRFQEADLGQEEDSVQESGCQLDSNREVDLDKGSHRIRRTFLEVQFRVVDSALDKELALGRDRHKAPRGEVQTRGAKQTRREQDSKRKSWVNKHRIRNRGTITSSPRSKQAIIKYLGR